MTIMRNIIATIFAAAFVCCGIIAPSSLVIEKAYADPPSWAPAHGWRAKHHEDDENRGYEDEDHYGHRQPVVVEVIPLPLFASHPHVEVACSNQPILGAVIGGTAGGLIGNQFGKGNGKTAATISGVLLGAVLGNDIGTDLSRQDADCMAQALEYGRPGTQVAWHDPTTKEAYSVLPVRNYRDEDGQYCREYQAHILIDGKIRNSYGTACRRPDGQWQIIK